MIRFRTASLEPYADMIEQWFSQGVQGVAIVYAYVAATVVMLASTPVGLY